MLIAGILFFGAVVQGAAGFGLGLVAVPLLVLAGLGLPEAITVAMLATAVQTGWNCYRHHADVDWRGTIPLLVSRLIGLPVGVFCLVLLVGEGPERVKQAIGAMVLLAVVTQWALKIKPRQSVGAGWTATAGLLSGWMGGLAGIGGPPLVLWVMAHDWPAKRARAFLWACILQLTPPLILLLWWRFPDETIQGVILGLLMIPVALLGAVVGAWLGSQLSRQRLRQVAYGMLVVIAIAAIVGPMFE